MKLTAFTDYSLRVLMHLAAEPSRRATVAEIAAAFGVSEHHLTKVVHFLGRRGWIRTVRGRGGGLLLARPAGSIRIGQVVRDTEGTAMPAECFGSDRPTCPIVACCGLRGALAQATGAFHAVLDRYTLADVATDAATLRQVLRIEPAAAAPHAAPATVPATAAGPRRRPAAAGSGS